MTANTYRAVSDRALALHGKDVFEAEFTPTEEQDQLTGGHLEIVPRAYKVLSNNYSAGKQGDVVDLALPVETESALISGGHIERVEDKPTPATKKKG
jgi:hypothetical protein